MSEYKNPNFLPLAEAQETMITLQFTDGMLAHAYDTPDTALNLKGKYTDPTRANSIIIVTLQSGTDFVLGNGVAVKLPLLDEETGEYGQGTELVQSVKIPKDSLDEIRIGQDNVFFASNDAVRSVIASYNKRDFVNSQSYKQIGIPAPFISAKRFLDGAVEYFNRQS